MFIYKVVKSQTGFKELEKEVSILLNKGWKPVGSIAFNQGYCYQAMVGNVEKKANKQIDKKPCQDLEHKTKELGAIDAMKKVDELT